MQGPDISNPYLLSEQKLLSKDEADQKILENMKAQFNDATEKNH